MSEINVKEVRSNISSILDRVEKGEEIIITRRGKRIARVSKLVDEHSPLKSLRQFRNQIRVSNASLSETVMKNRDGERY